MCADLRPSAAEALDDEAAAAARADGSDSFLGREGDAPTADEAAAASACLACLTRHGVGDDGSAAELRLCGRLVDAAVLSSPPPSAKAKPHRHGARARPTGGMKDEGGHSTASSSPSDLSVDGSDETEGCSPLSWASSLVEEEEPSPIS